MNVPSYVPFGETSAKTIAIELDDFCTVTPVLVTSVGRVADT